jgi:exonuclease III
MLLTLCGDIELNPGHNHKGGKCSKIVKNNDNAIQCDDCNKWVHSKCEMIDDQTYKLLGESEENWYCSICAANCGMCDRKVRNKDPAIQCDKCNLWIHNSCSLVMDQEYKTLQNTDCIWICPRCDSANLSDTLLNTSLDIENRNRFESLRVENNTQDVGITKEKNKTKTTKKVNYSAKIKIVTININSLRGKSLELQAFLDMNKSDIVAIQETKIDNSISTNELISENLEYDVYRKDRTMGGGGVMLLIKRHLDSMPMQDLENKSESVWAKIVVNGKTHYIGNWYRAPNSPSNHMTLLKDQLDNIRNRHNKNKQPQIHVLGDYNFGNINWDSKLNNNGKCLAPSEGQTLIDILDEHNAEQQVKVDTRENRTLDLIITTIPGLITDVRTTEKFSDHETVECSLIVNMPAKKKPRRNFFLYDKGDYDQMRSDATKFSKTKYFNGLQNKRDIETNWSMFKNFVEQSVKENIPSKTSKTRTSLPWINNSIRALIRRKNKTHAKAKQTGSIRLKNRWKTIRANIKKEINQAHDNYINNMLGDIKQDPKPFWKYINRQKTDNHRIPPLKTNNNKLAESDQEKAEALNYQFTSVYTKTIFDKIPYIKLTYPRMDDITTSAPGVEKLLKGLNSTKACGPDELHPRVLKELAIEISEILSHLFQQSLNTGILPADWKMANICPLFKKKDRTIPANYRPVSLTCICCKLLEHIVCSCLNKHFDKHNIITHKQHAFRKNHSCETQLAHVINDWAKSLDNKQQIDTFILDFEKAFDTVPHDLLKTKLNSYGVSSKTLLWIDAFLTGRKQRVVVNGTKSETSDVASGVPQGTVLGPLLFSIHINDIVNDISSEIRLFADDCVCYREIKSEEDCIQLQEDIDRLGNWAKKWGMRFQPVKCNIMQIYRKKCHLRYSYYLEGTELETLESIKYLGVSISRDLTWNRHIHETCNRANRTLGLLKRNLSKCPKDIRMQAYKGLIRPTLEYASTIWDPHTKILQEKLEAVQKRAARFVNSNYNFDPGSMTKILADSNLEPLKERRRQNRLILFYKGINSKANLPLGELVKPLRYTRHMHELTFKQIYASTDCYKYSFIPRTVKDWNQVSGDVLIKAAAASDPIAKFSECIRKD